jgi:hypothetical protein
MKTYEKSKGEKKEMKKYEWSYVNLEDIESFLKKRLNSLFSQRIGSISPKNKEELLLLIEYNEDMVFEALKNNKGASEEINSVTYGLIYLTLLKKNKDKLKKMLDSFKNMINMPNRVLRFLAVLNQKDPKPGKIILLIKDEKILLKVPKFLRKWIIKLLNDWKLNEELTEQFIQHLPIWKIFFKSIHAGEYKKYTNAINIVKCVRGEKEFEHKKVLSQFNSLLESKDEKIFDFLENRQGIFFRNTINICDKFSTSVKEEVYIKFLKKILPKLKLEQLFELSNVLKDFNEKKCKEHGKNCSTYFTKNGTIHWSAKREILSGGKLKKITGNLVDEVLFKEVDKKKRIILKFA